MTYFDIILHILIIAGFILAIIAASNILRHRRTPAGTIAWLLAIFLIPYLGIPLYFIFGGRKTRRIAGGKTKIQLPETDIIPAAEAGGFDRLLRAYNIPGATTGNKISLCNTGEEAYNQLIKLIEEAEESIFLLTFILAEDEIGAKVVELMAKRASEGLTVRVLLDGLGSMHTKREFLQPIINAGGEASYFNPVLKSPFHGRANLRDHRKMLIADEKSVMAGGTNIALEYIGPTPIEHRWKDLSFILKGPAVKHYSNIFVSDWEYATGKKFDLTKNTFENKGESVIQIVPSGPDVPGDPMYDMILTVAFSALKKLWIVTPYFVPDEALAQALTLAAHRGIDLRIIVPEKSNHRLTDLARGTYFRDIQHAGGKIYLYPEMVHAKTMIVDNKVASIGSANMDMRSLFLNYEISMLTYNDEDIGNTEKWIENLMKDSKIGVPEISELRNTAEGVVRIIAPLL
ncbi:PLDc N-terminal domain-containing protein [bacterium]|nr:PLDc N-terminal domain-containing protein [bacterium]